MSTRTSCARSACTPAISTARRRICCGTARTAYYIRDGRRVAAPFDVDTGVTVSNGGLNAPMTDMARYLAFLIGDPARAADYDLVLRRSSLEEMWRPVIAAGDDFTQGRMARTTQSGLSFFVDAGRAGAVRRP